MRVAAALLVCVLLGGVLLLMREGEARARRQLENRFQARGELAQIFLKAYVEDLLRRERQVAEKRLSAAIVTQPEFDVVVEAFGLEAAVVTDGAGRLLAVYPPKPEILGSDIAARYGHLRRALIAGSAVSPVVSSAATGAPIVAFATRYPTPQGWRVFSGAWDLSRAPLRAFLENLIPMKGGVAELVDESGSVVTSGSVSERALVILPPGAPRPSSSRSRPVKPASERQSVDLPIPGTPWRLIASVDKAVLYGPISGTSHLVPIFLFAVLSAFLVAATFLLVRLIESRSQLRIANADLDRLARYDRLTNVTNRRHLEEELEKCRNIARRHQQDFSLLLIDVDHFKTVNDEHGHSVGDDVLRGLAGVLAKEVRLEDTFGRWGGEEFLAILPDTPAAGALKVAERMRRAAESLPITTAEAQVVHATVSIGSATAKGVWDLSVLKRADDALYRAKAEGRNRVVSSEDRPTLKLATTADTVA